MKKASAWLRKHASAIQAAAAVFTLLGVVIGYFVGLFWPGLGTTDYASGYRGGQRIAECEHRAGTAEVNLELQQVYSKILSDWCQMTPEEQDAQIDKYLRDGTF